MKTTRRMCIKIVILNGRDVTKQDKTVFDYDLVMMVLTMTKLQTKPYLYIVSFLYR